MAQLRHFAAHGQAAARRHDLDHQILELCPQPFGDAIERYWTRLLTDVATCESLARARITPLQPSRIEAVWRQFGSGRSAGELFYGYRWSISP